MKISEISQWERILHNNLALYVLPDPPDWFVPSSEGDRILQHIRKGNPWLTEGCSPADSIRDKKFLAVLPQTPIIEPYPGRGDRLRLTRLREFWFHITDHCNLACRHCLFACNPSEGREMAFARFEKIIEEVHGLGGRTIYLTGGEPLVHPDIQAMCRKALSLSADTHLVVLTNGIKVPEMIRFFSKLPQDRIHFQLSIDGDARQHEAIRGKGTYGAVEKALDALAGLGVDTTLAMAVNRSNLHTMPSIVDMARQYRVKTIHYLWLFITGKSMPEQFADPEAIFPWLEKAYARASESGIAIDNVETMKEQVFTVPGTRHDLSNAGWESLAMGPDGRIYPTPALMGVDGALCGTDARGIETVWRQSPFLETLRSLSIAGHDRKGADPLRYIIGGGDPDHSFYATGRFSGGDPYGPLYRRIVLMLIEEHVSQGRYALNGSSPSVMARMGDRLENCEFAENGVALTHSNCVLSLSGARKKVETFYSNAADNPDDDRDILNPVCYPESQISHIPDYARVRSFGCGSPVMDARVVEGETIVDLGSGTGVECFIASAAAGKPGRVLGIDMTDTMLDMAGRASHDVAGALGYSNTWFVKGFLEDIPLSAGVADAVISNCVINLSADKARTLSEIHRILKPGGRLVVSDVVTDTRPSLEILNDPELRGECIAGAMIQEQLIGLLETVGFESIQLKKRFFYREVKGHLFYSLTYSAFKPQAGVRKRVVYPGPFAAVVCDSGEVLIRGQVTSVKVTPALAGDPSLFVLDEAGNVEGMDMADACACYKPPEAAGTAGEPGRESVVPEVSGVISPRSMTGCMVCAAPLDYLVHPEEGACHFCEGIFPVDARCRNGHFVCNACHSRDAVEVVKTICTSTRETDMITLMSTIRNHPNIPLHGPEHHFIVPGVILAAYRNSGGVLTNEQILAGIDRGRAVPGGVCAFWGTCGAVTGAGIAIGIICESTPLKPDIRQIVQQTASSMILELSSVKAARCCQRETWRVLELMADLSVDLLGLQLAASGSVVCRQKLLNRECAGKQCRYF